jgi:hypothetical protein
VTYDGLGRSQGSLSNVELRHIGKVRIGSSLGLTIFHLAYGAMTLLSALTLQQDEFGSQILYIFTLLLSKSAMLFLYLRLSPLRKHHIASWATLGVSAIWALVSTVLIALPCSPFDFWVGGPERCPDIVRRLIAPTTFIVLTHAVQEMAGHWRVRYYH